ncbi:HamA C-terminal domain-containing protein [Salipiger bermudensis]|uniref:HamA C-terminal domain-containing protein n=1 Tax=Salipiger bermudensis TaxID=344736 RepID=UPI001A8DA9BE|nr:DUF1837 domain-containing protein [Salipiger bermudensis]MBN9675961.1 DUF1837 domain-containing protein [Salipiger bermudensis]
MSLANDFQDGKWRSSVFHSFLWDHVAATALSAQSRASLTGRSGSELVEAAKNLRLTESDKVGSGSEIAEIFLYGLMTELFDALPVVPKIFYKQNVNDNAKGADSVHVVITPELEYSLWFGEAKLFNSSKPERLGEIVKSVINSLSTEKIRKENSIITGLKEIEELGIDKSLVDKIRQDLSSATSVDRIKSKINIPILLIHECEDTADCTAWSEEYAGKVIGRSAEIAEAYFLKQAASSGGVHMYSNINFFLILFPVPSKKKIVDRFTRVAMAKREEAED